MKKLLYSALLLSSCNSGIPYEQSSLQPKDKAKITDLRTSWLKNCDQAIRSEGYLACDPGDGGKRQTVCKDQADICMSSSGFGMGPVSTWPEACQTPYKACLKEVGAQCDAWRVTEKEMESIESTLKDLKTSCDLSVTAHCLSAPIGNIGGAIPFDQAAKNRVEGSRIIVEASCK